MGLLDHRHTESGPSLHGRAIEAFSVAIGKEYATRGIAGQGSDSSVSPGRRWPQLCNTGFDYTVGTLIFTSSL